MLFGIIIVAAVALLLALVLLRSNAKITVENARLNELAGYIKSGAMAYLSRQYKVVAIFVAVMAVVLASIPSMGIMVAGSFIFGALLSAIAGFIGMQSATLSNVRTASEAMKSEKAALNTAFTGGSVMGLTVVGLGMLGVGLIWYLTKSTQILTGFSLGASSIALFARVGGGIYTKAADVGADLVGKVEVGIPEDDARNPAVIADNVGDNVGDVAGMGADLFESYVGAIVSSIMLGVLAYKEKGAMITFALVASGIVATIIGILCVKLMKNIPARKALMSGTYISELLLLICAAVASKMIIGNYSAFFAVALGVVTGSVIGYVTEIYTSDAHKHVQNIVEQSKTGAATNILAGLSIGYKSTTIPVLLICAAVVGSVYFAGLFGVALAAVGMLATVGSVIAVDAYGPIADNAGGLAQMAELDHSVREITDKLDSIGNTTAAIGKGFSIGSAALTALALFSSYATAVGLTSINALEPRVIAGIFIGGMLSYLFSALTIESVSKAASKMVDEVRRQFREIEGIMDGTGKPDYEKCVDISTKAALREMIIPGVMAIGAPIVCGLLLGSEALAGLLVGATVVGVLSAIQMSNSGGAWDNAKKMVEGMKYGKGTDVHAATVVGDTVGDPLKDTSGPSLNILIKLMSIVAVVFAPLFM